MTSPLEQCRDALRRLTGAAFPVSTEIDGSGYAWSHAYLDSALPGARAALAAADAELAAQPEPAVEKLYAAQSNSESAYDYCGRLQMRCCEWGVYWRASDAHGVNLSHEQALELLRDVLGVEVDIAAPKEPASPTPPR